MPWNGRDGGGTITQEPRRHAGVGHRLDDPASTRRGVRSDAVAIHLGGLRLSVSSSRASGRYTSSRRQRDWV
jgi:hypothetical protein